MSIDDLANELLERFRPEAAAGVDMLVQLRISDDEQLLLRIADGTLELTREPLDPDVAFHFADLPTATRILRGQADAIDEFMNSRFRADGYLMMAFRLMEMFGSASLPPTPHD